MLKLWPLVVLGLAGCATHSSDPFAAQSPQTKVSRLDPKVRRSSSEISSQKVDLIWSAHKEMPNGNVRAIFYLSPEDTKLYPEVDEGRLLEMTDVPNVAPQYAAAITQMLASNRPKIDVTKLKISIPFKPPEVMRLSRRAYPIVIEGSRENMEIVAFRFERASRMIRIYNLTIDAAGSPIDDKIMDRIRDISGAEMNL